MKVCFKTADGLLCLDEAPIDDHAVRIFRAILSCAEALGESSETPPGRRYERTGERLAGVPVFEEVP